MCERGPELAPLSLRNEIYRKVSCEGELGLELFFPRSTIPDTNADFGSGDSNMLLRQNKFGSRFSGEKRRVIAMMCVLGYCTYNYCFDVQSPSGYFKSHKGTRNRWMQEPTTQCFWTYSTYFFYKLYTSHIITKWNTYGSYLYLTDYHHLLGFSSINIIISNINIIMQFN